MKITSSTSLTIFFVQPFSNLDFSRLYYGDRVAQMEDTASSYGQSEIIPQTGFIILLYECSVKWGDWETCPNFFPPFLENIDRRSCYDGSWELISVFPYPYYPKKAVSLTFEYLVGVSSQAASKGIGKKQVWIYIQKSHKYLKCVNQVSPTSLQISGMKTQPLQPLFVGEVSIMVFVV